MAVVIYANCGILISKYNQMVGKEFEDIQRALGLNKGSFDIINWYEWSFNHILENHSFLNVRPYYKSDIYLNIYRGIESEYNKLFYHCLRDNMRLLHSMSSNETVRAILTYENIIIATSPKIEF